MGNRIQILINLICLGLVSTQNQYRQSILSRGQAFQRLTDQTATSANNLDAYTGTAITQTQQKNNAGGFTTNTITTGVITQPFIKKTTITSDGYNYPVPTIPCYGANKVCTPNQYCVNGYVNENQLQFFDSSNQNCNGAKEQCCTLRPLPPPPQQCPDNQHVCVSQSLCNNGILTFDAQNAVATKQPTDRCYAPEVCCKQPTLVSESTVLTNEGYVVKVPSNQYLPAPVPEAGNEVPVYVQTSTTTTTRRPTTRYTPPQTTRYTPPQTTRYVPAASTTRFVQVTTKPPNTYVPPQIGDASNTDENFVRPPTKPPVFEDELPAPDTTRPAFVRPSTEGPALPPPVGCPAAMNCTESQFCSAMGVISKTPIVLTPEQELFRVPTTPCRSPDKGFTGVCCRDPDYVDPWPVGQLGQYNAEILGFDDGQYRPATTNQVQRVVRPPTKTDQLLTQQTKQVSFTQVQNPNQLVRQQQNTQTQTTTTNKFVSAGQQQQQSTGVKRFTTNSLQFSQSGDTKFKPFVKSTPTCAPRNYGTQPRGAGPWDTGFSEFPWQAMILLDTNRSLLCGGAIISPNMVITSANCVYGFNAKDISIKGGEWRLGVDEEPKTFQIVKVKNIIYHPQYTPTVLNYDVAILHLQDRLRYDTHIGAICLDENDVIPSASYENCVTTGWGKEVLRIHISNALMHYMPISLLPENESQRVLGENGFYPESHIAGIPKDDACDVDLGSALACSDAAGAYYLKGVYSSENQCGGSNQFVSFANIDVQWVKQVIKNPNQFSSVLPTSYQPAANSPVETRVSPNVGSQYLPPY